MIDPSHPSNQGIELDEDLFFEDPSSSWEDFPDEPPFEGWYQNTNFDPGTLDLSSDLEEYEQQYKIKKLETEITKIQQKIDEKNDLHKLRKTHSQRLFLFSITWLIVVWLIILLQGFGETFWPEFEFGKYKLIKLKFNLDNSVLIALITSTTASVLGLYGIAAYWLFKNGKHKKTEK